MKMIVAIIGPAKLPAIQAALRAHDVSLMTVSEVSGYGNEVGPVQIYRGQKFRRPVSKLRVEVAVGDSCAEAAVDAIIDTGFSESFTDACDDKLFVLALDECVGVDPHARRGVAVDA